MKAAGEKFLTAWPGSKGHSLRELKVVYFQYAFSLKAPGPKRKGSNHAEHLDLGVTLAQSQFEAGLEAIEVGLKQDLRRDGR